MYVRLFPRAPTGERERERKIVGYLLAHLLTLGCARKRGREGGQCRGRASAAYLEIPGINERPRAQLTPVCSFARARARVYRERGRRMDASSREKEVDGFFARARVCVCVCEVARKLSPWICIRGLC